MICYRPSQCRIKGKLQQPVGIFRGPQLVGGGKFVSAVCKQRSLKKCWDVRRFDRGHHT